MRGFGSVRKRKGSRFWWVFYCVGGRERGESSKSLRKEDAKELLRMRLEEHRLVPGLLARTTVGQVLDDHLSDCELRGVRAMVVIRRSATLVREFCGHQEARSLDARRVHELQEHLRGRGFAPATVNQIAGVLKTALRHAARTGRIGIVPEFPRRLREANARQGFLEHRDYLAILERLPDWAAHVFSFAYFSGWRKMEILTLRWDEVDFDGGMIRLDRARSKTGETRLLPIRGEIRSILERRIGLRVLGLPWVFHRDGRRVQPTTFRKYFSRATEGAGRPEVILHDTRRTTVRNLVRSGVPERVAMQLTGHKSRAVFERYNIVSEDELGVAAEKLHEYIERRATEAERTLLPFRKKT